jgi:hypothetical protein
MRSLEAELDHAKSLSVDELADAIESIGFECTRCGACCKAAACDSDGDDPDPHTATVFPDEIRTLTDATDYDWRDVARPMPYGLDDDGGETFEWGLQTDSCGDCTFYEESDDGTGACTVHDDRPLICETYPFSLASDGGADGIGTTEPMGSVVDRAGAVRAHECEGLGRDITRDDAEELAEVLKERAIRELEEAIGVRDSYRPVNASGVVVHDSEGQKRPDGTPLSDAE